MNLQKLIVASNAVEMLTKEELLIVVAGSLLRMTIIDSEGQSTSFSAKIPIEAAGIEVLCKLDFSFAAAEETTETDAEDEGL